MSVAVTPTSLYAHHVYSQGLHSSATEAVRTYNRSQYRTTEYIEVRTRLNRVPWHDATRHVLTITGATDASSQAWGGLIREPFGTVSLFRAATEFPAERYNAHINVEETFALHEVLKLATMTHSGCLKESTAVDDADNKAMHDACKKERSRNAKTHDLITKLFWHQVKGDLTLELLGMLRGELGGREFDQTRTHGARPTTLDHVRWVVENLEGGLMRT